MASLREWRVTVFQMLYTHPAMCFKRQNSCNMMGIHCLPENDDSVLNRDDQKLC